MENRVYTCFIRLPITNLFFNVYFPIIYLIFSAATLTLRKIQNCLSVWTGATHLEMPAIKF